MYVLRKSINANVYRIIPVVGSWQSNDKIHANVLPRLFRHRKWLQQADFIPRGFAPLTTLALARSYEILYRLSNARPVQVLG